MENKTLTAVEWLIEELDGLNRTQVEWHNAIDQALALERNQIIDAYNSAMGNLGEQYYTTKYGKQ